MHAGEARPLRAAWGFLDFGEGGAQRATLGLFRHLRRDLVEPSLLLARRCGALASRAEAAGVPVVHCRRLERPWDGGAVATLTARLRDLAVSALEVPLYSRAGPYFRLAALRAGLPLVVAHEWERGSPPGWRRRAVDRLLRRDTRFLAASRHHALRLIADGVAPQRVEVLYSGIEVEEFESGDGAALRAGLGIAPGAELLLVHARLHPAKGHRDLLSAFAAVLAERPRAMLLIAGDGSEREMLERQARQFGQTEAIRFLGHREDVPDLLAAADLVVLPSLREGFPAALLEAMAARRAVVATSVGGVSEAMTDGREGRLVPPGRPAALASAIVDLLAAPERREQLGMSARERAHREFRLDDATRRYEEVVSRWFTETTARARDKVA